MSENAGKLSKEFIEMHHDVPFHLLKGIRNRIVHDYGNVDMSIVYYTVKNDLYEFRKKTNVSFRKNKCLKVIL